MIRTLMCWFGLHSPRVFKMPSRYVIRCDWCRKDLADR